MSICFCGTIIFTVSPTSESEDPRLWRDQGSETLNIPLKGALLQDWCAKSKSNVSERWLFPTEDSLARNVSRSRVMRDRLDTVGSRTVVSIIRLSRSQSSRTTFRGSTLRVCCRGCMRVGTLRSRLDILWAFRERSVSRLVRNAHLLRNVARRSLRGRMDVRR